MAAAQLALGMAKASVKVSIQFQFLAKAFDPRDLDKVAETRLRVVFAMANTLDIVAVALAANHRGMLAKGWAWLGPDTVVGAEMYAIDSAGSTEAAKAAMNHWVYFEPISRMPATFFDRVREATRTHFPQQPADTGLDRTGQTLLTRFAGNMYDAIVLYWTAARSNMSCQSAECTVRAIINSSFYGIGGESMIDENGDLKESIQVMNYLIGPNGEMQSTQIGLYDVLDQRYTPLRNSTVEWPGGVRTTPSSLTQDEHVFSTLWLFLGAGTAAATVVIVIALLVRRKRSRLEAVMKVLFTETTEMVGTLSMEVADVLIRGITCSRLLRGEAKASELYKVVYVTLLCFGVAGTAVSATWRLRSARLVRDYVRALASGRHSEGISETRRTAQLFEFELAQTHRSKVALSLAMMTLVLQGA